MSFLVYLIVFQNNPALDYHPEEQFYACFEYFSLIGMSTETELNNQINDKLYVKPNIIFDTIVQNDPPTERYTVHATRDETPLPQLSWT